MLIKTDEFFYHVTTRSNHGEWFRLPLDEVWDISMESFNMAMKDSPAIISQFVLMSNHYHLLIRTPNSDIDRFMSIFNKNFNLKLRDETKLDNRMFGSNYKWSLITNPRHFQNVFRYIYQNPLRAKLVSNCSEYPYSTNFYYHRKKNIPFSFKPINYLESDSKFLNTPIFDEEVLTIKKGLHYSKYKEIKTRIY